MASDMVIKPRHILWAQLIWAVMTITLLALMRWM